MSDNCEGEHFDADPNKNLDLVDLNRFYLLLD